MEVDLEHFGMRIRVKHVRHRNGELFAFDYSITDPDYGEVKSDSCYECDETFDELVESCRSIAEAISLNPHDWLDDDCFDECERCDGNGSRQNVHAEMEACGRCRGNGRILHPRVAA